MLKKEMRMSNMHEGGKSTINCLKGGRGAVAGGEEGCNKDECVLVKSKMLCTECKDEWRMSLVQE